MSQDIPVPDYCQDEKNAPDRQRAYLSVFPKVFGYYSACRFLEPEKVPHVVPEKWGQQRILLVQSMFHGPHRHQTVDRVKDEEQRRQDASQHRGSSPVKAT